MDNEIRQNKATKEWVIYAPSRRKRPKDFVEDQKEKKPTPPDGECPFCPGNEEMLPGIILEMSHPHKDRWQTRIVPNKFPALIPDDGTERYEKGIYMAMPGYGRHEVIIESPDHEQNITQVSLEEMGVVVETYHKRYVELMQKHDTMMAIIFRNHGLRSGASLMHPHSQLAVTGIVPRYIRWREEEAQRYFDDKGRCVFCDMLRFELQEQQRIILENGSFLGFVPFAAEVPFEIWIMPKRHQADFGRITDEEKGDFAAALRGALARLSQKLNDPDYNYIINTSARYRADEPQLHWYLQIRPRLVTQAGFEFGSGMSINPTLPEKNADFLNRGQ